MPFGFRNPYKLGYKLVLFTNIVCRGSGCSQSKSGFCVFLFPHNLTANESSYKKRRPNNTKTTRWKNVNIFLFTTVIINKIPIINSDGIYDFYCYSHRKDPRVLVTYSTFCTAMPPHLTASDYVVIDRFFFLCVFGPFG